MAREIQITRGLVVIVDDEDHDRIAGHWTAVKSGRRFYAARHLGGRVVLMHRLIADAPPTQHVDHINGDGLDNRRANLRLCTRTQNMGNRVVKRGKVGGARFKGVHPTRNGRWCSYCDHRWLGSFDTQEEAARAYDAFARTHFGEFARLNFALPGEQSALTVPA